MFTKLMVHGHLLAADLKDFLQDRRGLTTVEYAVAGGLIAAVVVAAFKALGIKVGTIISGIDSQL